MLFFVSCSRYWFICCCLFLAGCDSRRPVTIAQKDPQKQSTETTQDWMAKIAKANDLMNISQEILATVQLADRQPWNKDPAYTQKVMKDLENFTQLNQQDFVEVDRNSFTSSGLDSHYLAECLLLHDVIKNLELQSLPPAQQIELAFEWVCRQIYHDPLPLPPSPIWYALQRGYGGGFDRAYVFLGMLQQLGFEGFFIGPESMKDQYSATSLQDGRVANAPFLAVGVRLDHQIYLFDFWNSRPYPGLGGKGIATLSDVVEHPEIITEWEKIKPTRFITKLANWKDPVLFLAPPLLSLSPRMAFLDSQLKSEKYHCSVDILAVKQILEQEFVTGGKKIASKVLMWNPLNDKNTPTRVLGYFLPIDKGGLDQTPKSLMQVYSRYVAELYRLDLFQTLKLPLIGPAKDLIENIYLIQWRSLLEFLPDKPRLYVVRGLFSDAAALLTSMKDAIEAERESSKGVTQFQQIQQWCQEADRIYAGLNRAKRNNDQTETAHFEAVLKAHMSSEEKIKPVMSYFVRETSKFRSAEVNYLLALAVHEQAEKERIRYLKSPTLEWRQSQLALWKNAKEWWERYCQNYPEIISRYPQRQKHAQSLLERSEKMIKELETEINK